MFGGLEIGLLSAGAILLVIRALPYFGIYRPLFGAGGVLFLITAMSPRTANPLGQFLFGTTGGGLRLPRELFGIVWWILGAWLLKSLLDLVLRRFFFPDNDEPHARRLFADLASALIYVLAFVGIVGTVFKEPVSTLLATSGVLAVVLGLALQNTLGDLFSGLAINIERPYGAGDWITLPGDICGQVMQVNWRATRLRTWTHDLVTIPNSVMSKAIITNHTRPAGPHSCALRLKIDFSIPPERVLAALKLAATPAPNPSHGPAPRAFARAFSDCLVEYELIFGIDNFATSLGATSAMLAHIATVFRDQNIPIGGLATDIRLFNQPEAAAPKVSPESVQGS